MTILTNQSAKSNFRQQNQGKQNQNFTQLANVLNRHLSGNVVKVYWAMQSAGPTCYLREQSIADACGLSSRNTVRKAIKRLLMPLPELDGKSVITKIGFRGIGKNKTYEYAFADISMINYLYTKSDVQNMHIASSKSDVQNNQKRCSNHVKSDVQIVPTSNTKENKIISKIRGSIEMKNLDQDPDFRKVMIDAGFEADLDPIDPNYVESEEPVDSHDRDSNEPLRTTFAPSRLSSASARKELSFNSDYFDASNDRDSDHDHHDSSDRDSVDHNSTDMGAAGDPLATDGTPDFDPVADDRDSTVDDIKEWIRLNGSPWDNFRLPIETVVRVNFPKSTKFKSVGVVKSCDRYDIGFKYTIEFADESRNIDGCFLDVADKGSDQNQTGSSCPLDGRSRPPQAI